MNAKLTIVHYCKILFQVKSHSVTTMMSVVRCYGITKDPKTNNFMMVMEYAIYGSLRQHLDKNFNSLNWTEKLSSLLAYIASGLESIHKKGAGVLSYTTHIQAVYTSRLLNYKNLPEPRNADDNDNSSATEYSGNWNSLYIFFIFLL
jgi:serine/threonine protein kinase